MVARYNHEIHHRRSIRLKGYDYSTEGVYFVTICAQERECLFGEVVKGEMVMNEAGARVQAVWDELPCHYPQVRLDAFAMMPNHVHGIVVLSPVEARFIAPSSIIAPNPVPTVGGIVRGFKARCTHAINQMRNIRGIPVWQRNYYEHIIRDEVDYNRIAEYISTNPQRWMSDTLHPDNTVTAPKSVAAPCHDVRAQSIAPLRKPQRTPGAAMNDIPAGYKQTEVGMIPEDWLVSRLGDCGEVIMGQSPPGSSYNRTGIGSPLINGPTEFTDLHPIKIQWTTQPARFCKTGDLLICVRGSSTGRTNYANDSYAIGRGVAAIRAKDHNDTEYLSYQVISGVSDILAAATGSTFPSVDGASFRKIVVPLPSPAEQRAIAGALSDVDALIGALDRLIAKKRDLKQAAMQQLLTGRTRLPGFIGVWEVKRLGELAEIISGGTPKTGEPSYWNGSMKWCTPTDITGCSAKYLVNTERAISADGLASCSAQLLPIGSLLLCSRATIGEVRIAGCEICTNQGFKSLVCMPGVSNEFLYYKLLSMKSQMIERAIGSTFLEISKKDTAAIELSIPEHAEQTAIAAVLSDMDAELAALTQRRDKTRALKQGMMQELLTGKTRLL